MTVSVEEAMQGVHDSITDLNRQIRHSRRVHVLLGFSLFLDIALSIALGLLALNANHLSHQAQHSSSGLVVQCESGNEARAVETQLWDYVLTLTPAPPPGSQQAANVAQFRTYIKKAFAPRNCAKIG